MANEIILQKHMNAEEKAHALKLFKQLLTEKPEILKDTRYTPAQTIGQSCFISGGFGNEAGEFDAVFFPNSDFKGLKIVCLAFQNGKPCLVCHHEIKLQNGIKAWESVEILENLIYEDEEMDETNNLKKAINCYNEYISILEIFKRKRTKSGGNFKRLFENFEEGHAMSLHHCSGCGIFKSSLNVDYKGVYFNIYLKIAFEQITPDEIEKALNNEIEENKRRIKEAFKKIEIIHAETLEAVKIYNNIFDKSKKFKTRILRRILENRLHKF